MALKRKSKSAELEAVYRKQRDNEVLREFRGEAEFLFPQVGCQYPEVLFICEQGPYSDSTLRKCAGEVGLNVHRCSFTTLWKHHRDKSPGDYEYGAVLAFLEDEIAILRPKVVVPVGQEVLNAFLEVEAISAVHGNPYDWDQHWLIPIPRPPFYYTYKIGMSDEQKTQFEEELAAFRYDLTTVAYYAKRGK